ncbi:MULTISPECIES: hypothetical protein [Amycolatopsis]|uniref:Uncharacterized protein n=2 Tax=Amycolatopsis TaxID=1813 RepID=A0A1I3P901_9PSEU|nr:hypothetical protein [Amycolatopsis sacchari]SFJ18038.1 hypothetical protein SAMN05421835_103328 [Amycolatopsis sacchari]
MSLFGQVWLWSAAAFVLGVLLTWLLLVRPAQARNRSLERQLLDAKNAAPERRSAAPTRTLDEPDTGTRALDPEPVQPTRAFEPEPEPEPLPEPVWHERDSFGGRVPEHDESDAEKTSIFTPYPQEAERGSLFAPDAEAERGSLFEPGGEPDRGSLFDPVAEEREPHEFAHQREDVYADEHPSGFHARLEPEDEHEHGSLFEPEESYGAHAAVDEPPAYAFGNDDDARADDEAPAESTAVLPRRQPRSTPPSSFEPPRPSVRSIERREPAVGEGGRSGSLFEPAVRPNAGAHAAPEPAAPAPPPARTPVSDASVPPGPFGPGSAMPRPGGGRPSDEFTVKASVTALRYCTEESPQFARMIAEVWFRSAADAERVGFRPLS